MLNSFGAFRFFTIPACQLSTARILDFNRRFLALDRLFLAPHFFRIRLGNRRIAILQILLSLNKLQSIYLIRITRFLVRALGRRFGITPTVIRGSRTARRSRERNDRRRSVQVFCQHLRFVFCIICNLTDVILVAFVKRLSVEPEIPTVAFVIEVRATPAIMLPFSAQATVGQRNRICSRHNGRGT